MLSGTGSFNQSSIQVPGYVKATISNSQAVVVGQGHGVWDNVHVEDLAQLYTLCLLNILEQDGKALPFGKEGIIFSGNGRHTWGDLAQGVADAAYATGKISSNEVKSVSLEEGARVLTGGDELLVELGFSSTSRTESVVGRKLGWNPTRGSEAWQAGFSEEVKAATEKENK